MQVVVGKGKKKLHLNFTLEKANLLFSGKVGIPTLVEITRSSTMLPAQTVEQL